jgi:cell division protein FtsB
LRLEQLSDSCLVVWWRSGGAAALVALIVGITALAGSAVLGSDGLTRLLRLRAERQELGEAAVERLQANAALRAEIERLRGDPKYLERLARKRLGLVKPDEMAYRFRDADTDPH